LEVGGEEVELPHPTTPPTITAAKMRIAISFFTGNHPFLD
jgi:hypothetical protein